MKMMHRRSKNLENRCKIASYITWLGASLTLPFANGNVEILCL